VDNSATEFHKLRHGIWENLLRKNNVPGHHYQQVQCTVGKGCRIAVVQQTLSRGTLQAAEGRVVVVSMETDGNREEVSNHSTDGGQRIGSVKMSKDSLVCWGSLR